MAEFLDDQDTNTRLCDNCKKEIPVFNFTIHEIHCQRNIGMCPICKEPLPKSDMKTHVATEHCQVTCRCNKKLEKRQLQMHEETECPLRLALCQHCDLELSVLKLKDHEDYCGARTELCGSCGRNVLVKDLKTHPEVCGKEGEERRDAASLPPSTSDESWSHDGMWLASHLLSQIEALDPPLRLPLRAFESDLYPTRTASLRDVTTQFPIQNNLFEEQERQARNRSCQPPREGGEENANLDFMLALSLQNEGQAPHMAGEDSWRAVCDAERPRGGPGALSDKMGAAGETMLPCEFCEELYPEELLIDHQTSCNPSCALPPPLTMGSSSPKATVVEDSDVIFQKFLQQANNLDSFMGLTRLPTVEDSIIIPCEFCGVQLEEEVLFHHQDQCDQRPATANTCVMEGFLRQDSQSRDISPELPRRRVKHQGDLPSSYMDDIKQEEAKGPTCPLPPSRPLNNMLATCNRLSKAPSGSRPGCQPSPPRVLKLSNPDSPDVQGRIQNSPNMALVPDHLSANHSARNGPETLAPSFPHGPVGRHGASGRSEGSRSSRLTPTAVSYRNRTTKAKSPKQSGAGDAEEEE
ncbi:PREDICTED: TRAF-type zinc finger domain-containing protein 1 [Elephantulus edwardii]|uniref:TRAF-type zinc finger domain-containing protein 1 n=1 Tax=Elephantulus edwardii TaxID=28737 RepID=UPI0003F0C070|nr:PREDICTED: TRAF-type zinc finger domain-containing protein 1 [Elephantulus edwardii]